MTHLTNEGIKEDVRSRNSQHSAAAEEIDFGCFPAEELEQSIIQDVNTLKAVPMLEGIDIRGYVLSTEEGHLREL